MGTYESINLNFDIRNFLNITWILWIRIFDFCKHRFAILNLFLLITQINWFNEEENQSR